MQSLFHQANKQVITDEESYECGNICKKAILARLPHQDEEAMYGSISLKRKIRNKQVNYFLRS